MSETAFDSHSDQIPSQVSSNELCLTSILAMTNSQELAKVPTDDAYSPTPDTTKVSDETSKSEKCEPKETLTRLEQFLAGSLGRAIADSEHVGEIADLLGVLSDQSPASINRIMEAVRSTGQTRFGENSPMMISWERANDGVLQLHLDVTKPASFNLHMNRDGTESWQYYPGTNMHLTIGSNGNMSGFWTGHHERVESRERNNYALDSILHNIRLIPPDLPGRSIPAGRFRGNTRPGN